MLVHFSHLLRHEFVTLSHCQAHAGTAEVLHWTTQIYENEGYAIYRLSETKMKTSNIQEQSKENIYCLF